MGEYINRMKGQDYIDATLKYLDYLKEHLDNVARAFDEVSEACADMKTVHDDFYWNLLKDQVIHHDVSKFSAEEFTQYRDAFFPIDEVKPLGEAWEHHKQWNTHHWETANSVIDIFHMVIDWTAMGYKFGGTAQEFYEKHKDKINLSPENTKLLYQIFKRLEKAAIKNRKPL